jgi:hypothetical protein
MQRFTPLLIDAARPRPHVPDDQWFVDETYVKVAGRWIYLYRAIDQLARSSMSSWQRNGISLPFAGSSPARSTTAHARPK